MTAWIWRHRLEQAQAAVVEAEKLRDTAQEQRREVASITPKVDAVTASLRRLNSENHFGPMIDNALRGRE